MAGTEHSLMPLRLFKPSFNRVLLKDPLACLMSEYLTQKFQFQTLVLFRHPAGFVSSLKRLGWPGVAPIRRFLACKPLMQDWLAPYQDLMEGALSGDNIRSYSVLHGCLNKVLWGFVQRNENMKALQFEPLCSDPIQEFQHLYDELNLPYDDHIKDKHLRMTTGSKEPTHHPHQIVRNSSRMEDRWKRELSQKERSEIREIWNAFDIPMYCKESDWN
jgi:hypothetical protein